MILKPLIFNLKMNFTLKEIIQYKNNLEQLSFPIIVCPSFCYLPLMHSKKYKLGAQNVSAYNDFAHTGEVSAKMLKSLDVKAILLNHFEANEDLKTIKIKLNECLKNDLDVYIFLSDNFTEHNYQYTILKLAKDMDYLLQEVKKQYYKKITFIYEPSWLIGKEASLNKNEIISIFKTLKNIMNNRYQYLFPLYYGGGINKDTFKELINVKIIDGLVLGHSCLDLKNLFY